MQMEEIIFDDTTEELMLYVQISFNVKLLFFSPFYRVIQRGLFHLRRYLSSRKKFVLRVNTFK